VYKVFPFSTFLTSLLILDSFFLVLYTKTFLDLLYGKLENGASFSKKPLKSKSKQQDTNIIFREVGGFPQKKKLD